MPISDSTIHPIATPPSTPLTNQHGRDGNHTNHGAGAQDGTRGARNGRGRGRGRGRARGGHITGGIHRVTASNNTRQNGEGETSEVNGDTGDRNSSYPSGGPHTGLNQPIESSNLQADATVFVPGQVHHAGGQRHPRSRAPRAQPAKARPRARKASIAKSSAPDIATRTHEDISNGVYECPICTAEVTSSAKIWSCKTCWTVFHLTCIKKWATNEGSRSAPTQQNGDDTPQPRQWRCPGCNLPKDILPSEYTCWCEKEYDPTSIPGMAPHSCGQTCAKERLVPKKCPHPCELICHAGPCSPCKRMGPTQECFCGKQSTTRRCLDTNYESGWSCGEPCGKLMGCGHHHCPRSCHEGACASCMEVVEGRCYCGKVKRGIICSERNIKKQSAALLDDGVTQETWTGLFDCENLCERPFDCGKHYCRRPCHPQDLATRRCPSSPDLISRCLCGKTTLQDLAIERTSCSDPIPNCDKQCSKRLPCEHECQQTCHQGDCPPCFERLDIACRCGRTKSRTICHQGNLEPPQCGRQCRTTLNCGRHECGERCCSGERKASERQATKRKLKPLGAARMVDDGIEAEHICTRLCGRMLKCGNHTCPELCHKGPCGSCREAIFEEISCHCGKTVLQPPLPCGTAAPPCRFDCERLTTCGHPRVAHNCHGDDESCPKCPFLQQKACLCGKKTLKNQPCFFSEVRCGERCGRVLKCGSHFCRKECHRQGQCEDVGSKCQQLCGKPKKACGHPCEEPCHAPSTCREEKACQNKIIVTCECQRRKQELKCNASKSSDGNSKKTLTCDDECARLERNQRLASALDIDPETHTNDHVPYSSETLKMYREQLAWAQPQEREMRIFAADETEKRKRYKPMPPPQRAFIHSLAEDFGFDSESIDPESHRHVHIFKTPRFVKAPMKTLAECVRIRVTQAVAPVPVPEPTRPPQPSKETWNGFLLLHPKFGLTVDELRTEFLPSFQSTPGLSYDISFPPASDERIIIHAQPASASTAISPSAIAASLKALKPSITTALMTKGLAASIHLCTLDSHHNITHRDIDAQEIKDGWSQVVAKGGATPRNAPTKEAIGGRSGYAVLGRRVKEAEKDRKEDKMRSAWRKMDKAEEEVVDDWEVAANKQEGEQPTAEVAADGVCERDMVAKVNALKIGGDAQESEQDREQKA